MPQELTVPVEAFDHHIRITDGPPTPRLVVANTRNWNFSRGAFPQTTSSFASDDGFVPVNESRSKTSHAVVPASPNLERPSIQVKDRESIPVDRRSRIGKLSRSLSLKRSRPTLVTPGTPGTPGSPSTQDRKQEIEKAAIGIALGSPSMCPGNSNHVWPRSTTMGTVTKCSSGKPLKDGFDDQRRPQARPGLRRLTSVGNLFLRRKQSSATSNQPRAVRPRASIAEAHFRRQSFSFDTTRAWPARGSSLREWSSQKKTPSSHNTIHEEGGPTHLAEIGSRSVASRKRLSASERARKRESYRISRRRDSRPRLDVDIPDACMERYSIMFSDLLGPKKLPRSPHTMVPSLLERRRCDPEKLTITSPTRISPEPIKPVTNESKSSDSKSLKSQCSVSKELPQPSMNKSATSSPRPLNKSPKSPAYSLFPKTKPLPPVPSCMSKGPNHPLRRSNSANGLLCPQPTKTDKHSVLKDTGPREAKTTNPSPAIITAARFEVGANFAQHQSPTLSFTQIEKSLAAVRQSILPSNTLSPPNDHRFTYSTNVAALSVPPSPSSSNSTADGPVMFSDLTHSPDSASVSSVTSNTSETLSSHESRPHDSPQVAHRRLSSSNDLSRQTYISPPPLAAPDSGYCTSTGPGSSEAIASPPHFLGPNGLQSPHLTVGTTDLRPSASDSSVTASQLRGHCAYGYDAAHSPLIGVATSVSLQVAEGDEAPRMLASGINTSSAMPGTAITSSEDDSMPEDGVIVPSRERTPVVVEGLGANGFPWGDEDSGAIGLGLGVRRSVWGIVEGAEE